MNENRYKMAGIVALVALVLYAVYYFAFRTPSGRELAVDLDLYTGDPEHDACLNDMMDILEGAPGVNMEWTILEAASWVVKAPPEDYWRVSGQVLPVSGLLLAVDTTFDYYKTLETAAALIPKNVVDEYVNAQNTASLYDQNRNYTAQEAADIVGYPFADLENAWKFYYGGENYTPYPATPFTQSMVSALWGRFNAFKYLKEHPVATGASGLANVQTDIVQNKK